MSVAPTYPETWVVRGKREGASHGGSIFRVTAHELIGSGKLLEHERRLGSARIERQGLVHIFQRIVPASLPAINVTGEKEYERFDRQRALGHGQFIVWIVVNEMNPIAYFRPSY